MKPITVTVDLDLPASEVFAFLSDFENNPRFQKGMRSCVWTSPPPHGVGSTYDQVAHFLGREIVSSFVVVEHAPGHRVKIESTSGPFPIEETRIVEARGEGCRVTAIVGGDASGFLQLLAPLQRPLVKRSVTRDYRQELPRALGVR
ncbi:MAG TPA: SRPBCC family protein [Acidimicrobiales bacterium]|nr:SRPBCC family protein [Acidimicrobiales bacterium]